MVQDTYSKRTIKEWLKYYQALESGDQIPGAAGNSAAKAYDCISSRLLLKIMVDDAIKKLPKDLRAVVVLRWVRPVGVAKALSLLGGITAKTYYGKCDAAVDRIHTQINGCAGNYTKLVEKL